MTSVWVAEHGWVYLNDRRDRDRAKGIVPGTLTLGTDNGSAFTAAVGDPEP
jgi:hypothetical protein